jgi:glucoside 3-dehydrogenase (cytochrome c) hitch-hiker subunit
MEYPPNKQSNYLVSRRRIIIAGTGFAAAFAARLSLGQSDASASDAGKSPLAVLNADLALLSRTLMDTILPEDDTPGALSVGAPAFLEVVLSDLFSSGDRLAFLSGLEALGTVLHTQSGATFPSLPAERRVIELARFDADTYMALASSSAASSAELSYVRLKEITLIAFFTSKEIATTMLNFSPVPGHYEPDLPISAQPRADYLEAEDSGAYRAHEYAGKIR